MTTEEIKKTLNENVAHFSYTKKDGSVRYAKGTTNSTKLSANGGEGKGGENKVKDAGYISYFDLDKKEWRCFAESKFLGFTKVDKVEMVASI